MKIRRAKVRDIPELTSLVRNIVLEVYTDLVARNGVPPAGNGKRWDAATVAESDGAIIAVGLAADDFISDLWVAKPFRGMGVGARLLNSLEKQIAAQGYEVAHLHVVTANHRARAFYLRQKWREGRTFPHERDGHNMTAFSKTLR